MAAVRQRNTKPEVDLRRALYAAGIRGWRCNYKGASGRPDLAWPDLRVAIFVDGAFWHGHPSRHRPGRSGAYWDEKIAGNVARDRRVDSTLQTAGWEVVRVWDFEVERNLVAVTDRIATLLSERLRLDTGASSWKHRLLERSAGVNGPISRSSSSRSVPTSNRYRHL
jgi:DNA mismatch endonuclease (patch repair protein)